MSEYWVVSVPVREDETQELPTDLEKKATNQREAFALAIKNSTEFGSACVYNSKGFVGMWQNGKKWKLHV